MSLGQNPLPKKSSQDGFAMILALLALTLLTTLGLALASGSSTEMQIATNQRWSEAARFNAEAGIEYGKNLLSTVGLNWADVLPPSRNVAPQSLPPWNATAYNGNSFSAASPTLPGGGRTGGTRNWENWKCDVRGYGAGYGIVLEATPGTPEQYQSNGGGFPLNGAFTLWVRRPVMWTTAVPATLQDYPGNDVLILVSEGVAPFSGADNNLAFAATNRATYTIETLFTRNDSSTTVLDITAGPCAGRAGQAGGSAQGTNSSGCVASSGVGGALAGVTSASGGVGTGDVK